MAFRLALHMGQIDVDRMLEGMTPEQFDEWYAYYQLEPFGDWWTLGQKLLKILHDGTYEGRPVDEADLRLSFTRKERPKVDKLNEAAIAARYSR